MMHSGPEEFKYVTRKLAEDEIDILCSFRICLVLPVKCGDSKQSCHF